MSILQRLLHVLPSWRSIVAPKWLPPPRPWWRMSRVAFYAIVALDAILITVLRGVSLAPGLMLIAYFAAGLGVTMTERRLPSST